jgi:hypothetical protein
MPPVVVMLKADEVTFETGALNVTVKSTVAAPVGLGLERTTLTTETGSLVSLMNLPAPELYAGSFTYTLPWPSTASPQGYVKVAALRPVYISVPDVSAGAAYFIT